ncbi:nose resistant to fluoxetine protein 6-like isoform X2 [Scaptodrosophila lebanonensis]|uniref:Nose resistant to fluoxetine protein 6-like isoform X2 n=1 Tax=Drosophila lebanonensis TaxID=7225 RepID=A0A6J2TSS8_DROLE|nr:nose resistant to fluoxetine protein 6-like isoform X2 [Scaptodrosophila lebanonensis]
MKGGSYQCNQNNQFINYSKPLLLAPNFRLDQTPHQDPGQITESFWGVCVPDSCGIDDINIHLSNWLQHEVVGDPSLCQTTDSTSLQMSKAMFVYACIILFFVLLSVLSTLYHAYLLTFRATDDKMTAKEGNQTLIMALLSFSIIENTKKLFQASKDQLGLNSINGIKALAMLLILAGHALSFILGGPMYNSKFINEQLRLPTFSFLTNSLLFVDTFLLLSGFLFCRILLIELERRRGKLNVLVLYVARYIRLTPAYMAIIGFYMTWFPYVGSGPIWKQRISLEQQRCQSSWWLNILYINNYINTDLLCMFQSWYLSVDSQLFFVAPIVIYITYRSRLIGLRLLYALVVITAAIPFAVTYVEQLDPTLMVYADEVHDLARNDFYIKSYIKTHMRASAYIIGLLVGYLVHVMQEKRITLSPQLVRYIWLSAVFIGVGSMYGVTRFYVVPYTVVESSLYAGFHKLGWNFAVGWLVLAVTTGHAGWLQRALSIRAFAPISRLTYCAYLSNGIVELYHMASIRQPNYMGYLSLTNDVFSHMLDTFLLAVVVCLLFESPIHALERILLRSYGGRETGHGSHNCAKQGKETTPNTSEEQLP